MAERPPDSFYVKHGFCFACGHTEPDRWGGFRCGECNHSWSRLRLRLADMKLRLTLRIRPFGPIHSCPRCAHDF